VTIVKSFTKVDLEYIWDRKLHSTIVCYVATRYNDRYEQVLTAVELTMTDLEEKALSDPTKETINHLDRLSRQLIVVRRHFWRVRDVVNFLKHIEKDTDEVKYIQMAYDNITQLLELVDLIVILSTP